MQVIQSDVKGWEPSEGFSFVTPEGLVLDKDIKAKMCGLYGIPGTLINVDQKFGTTTLLSVCKSADSMKDVKFLVDDDMKVVSPIDPKSRFIEDDEFAELVDNVSNIVSMESDITVKGNRRASFDIEQNAHDNFLGDLFKRKVILERKAEGGVVMMMNLLRLVCTNGMLVPDKQFSHVSRQNVFDEAMVSAYLADAHMVELDAYLNNLWTKDGEMLEASVSDYLQMKTCLSKIVTPEDADLAFPTDPIESHYSAQGIDIFKINDRLRSRMPSGLPYVDCFNFLTHAVKSANSYTLSDEIEVAKFIAPSRLRQLKESDIAFHGKPKFDPDLVRLLKGDAN